MSEIKAFDLLTISPNFVITVKNESGGKCAYGACNESQQVTITKDKIATETVSGSNPSYSNHYEYPSYEQYDNVVEQLDWAAFQALPSTLGCPGCADGPIETITISNGNISKTITLEGGMQVKEIQSFLDTVNGYVGLGGGMYYGYGSWGVAVEGSAAAPPSVVTPASEPMP